MAESRALSNPPAFLLKSGQPWSYAVAVQVETHGAVDVSAVDMGAGCLQALQDVRSGKAELGSEATRDDGETWLHGLQNLWGGGCGAAVMSHLQEVSVGMVQAGDKALDGFFRVTL